MAEIHKCGQGWAYCDGNCTTCAVNNYYTTTGVNTQVTTEKDYPPYLDYPKERKKQTNADKYFRNVTDEEIVEAWYYIYSNVIFASTNSRQGLLEWLKQEVSDD